MAAAETAENTHDFADFWAVHAEREGQPWLADWAKSKPEADEKLAKAKQIHAEERAADPEVPETEFWVIQMTTAEVASFQTAGVIPEDG